jgi:eukaryotic-like serine/threonine-protein kinase
MFHVKRIEVGENPQTHSKAAPVAYSGAKGSRRAFALIALVLFATLVVGCGQAAGSRGWAAPVKTDSYLMVSAGKGRIDGLDPSSREEKWRFPRSWQLDDENSRDLSGIYGDPIVARDGTVYFGDYNGHVYVFRPGDFNPNASEKPKAGALNLNDAIIGGIALDEANNLLFVAAGKSLYSVNTRDLITRIQNKDASVKVSKLIETGSEIWSTPLFANGKVYVGSLDGNLYAIDPATGKEAWRFATGKGIVTKPAIDSGTIYVGGFGGRLFAVDLADGKEKWAFPAQSWVWSRPVITGGKVYFSDFESNVYALNASNGDLVWKNSLGKGPIRSALAVANDTVVVATEDGWLVGLSADGKDKRWEKKLETSFNADLVVSGDTILLAPTGCVEIDKEKSYYLSVDPRTGDLTRAASGVC